MTRSATTVLEWTYEPPDFFEIPVTVNHPDGAIDIKDGVARGEFAAGCYDIGRAFWEPVHELLDGTLLAQQILVHRTYSLSKPSVSRIHQDGRRDVAIFPESVVMRVTVSSPDLVLKDASGKIVRDTKAERLAKQENFRANVSRALTTSRALRRMLQSFRNALNDSDNLFIHLHEVRETLTSEFGGEPEAREATGISNTGWRKFGRLANDEPLLEGRHRGKHSTLRKATAEEVDWALKFSQQMIEGYLKTKS